MTPDKNIKTPYTDLKPKIKQIVTKKWQQSWDENPHNNLIKIQPILKERKLDPNNTRREETTLTRLRIGHTRLTQPFILKEEPPPQMSMWKPILNQAHFDRMHKTQPHQEKVLYSEQHKGTIIRNSSLKHNQLLKNNWPPIKDIGCVTNTFDHQVYTNKKLWPISKY